MNECSPINSLEKEMVRNSGCPGGRSCPEATVGKKEKGVGVCAIPMCGRSCGGIRGCILLIDEGR